MPEEWARQVETWSRLARAPGRCGGHRTPEYLFYQLLLGAWPAELTGIGNLDEEKLRFFVERMEGAIVKSMREAKGQSNWAVPNTSHEEAMLAFVRDARDTSRPNAFLAAFLPFQQRIAELGVRNSLRRRP